MRTLHSLASVLLSAVALSLCAGPAAGAGLAGGAQGRASAPGAARRERASALATPIAAAESSLEKLRKDKRRRKYRDGWESISGELSAAIKKAPSDPRADEARLLVAQVKGELWGVSRSPQDARSAVAAGMTLDELRPGSEAGRTGLLGAMRVAHGAKLAKEETDVARRLKRYPRSSETAAAIALAPAADPEPRKAAPPGKGLDARAAGASDRVAMRPVDAAGEAADDSRAAKVARAPQDSGGEAGRPAAAATHPRSALREEREGRNAPPSPDREPDTDVPASAQRVLDQLVQAARATGASDLLGEKKSEPSTKAASGKDKEAKPPEPEAPPPLDMTNKDPSPEKERVEADDDAPPEPEEGDEGADPEPHHTLASAPRAAEPGDPAAEAHAAELRRSALKNQSASIAAQLGLKVRRVVVDAGHGGRDTGAIGPHGLREKDVTLAIARKLADKLRAQGLEVVMTRDADEYVALGERTRIANDANADLFVSVHCNAARQRKLSGVETWTLNVSADRYSQRLAAFENAEADATVSNLRLILADLATKANASDARELAETVQGSMVKTLRTRVGKVRDNGTKQALFYVLLGTHMPSILVETAFLSNPDEEKRLKSAKYQDGTAEAIAKGVGQFIGARRELARAP